MSSTGFFFACQFCASFEKGCCQHCMIQSRHSIKERYMQVTPVDFSEVDGDVPFPFGQQKNIIQWIDHKAAKASNVQKSYLGFARRAIINSGIAHDDIAGLCHNMLVRQRGLVQVGAYNLYTMFDNTISIIRAFERAQKRGSL